MDINSALAMIKSNSISMDILFGNSPRDMAVRAMENSDLIKVVSYFEKARPNVDFVLVGIKMKLHSLEVENSLSALGTITAYFEVLRNFPSEDVIKFFSQVLTSLGPDNFLKKIIEYQFSNLKSNTLNTLDVGLESQIQNPVYTIKSQTAGNFSLALN